MKIHIHILCKLGILALVLLYSLKPSCAEDKIIRIGFISPLSGPVVSFGKYVSEGVRLAYDNLDPKIKGKIQLLIEDDQFDPKQTISAYRKLEGEGHLDLVLVVGSPTANALAPITEKTSQTLVAIAASDPNIVKDRPHTFIHWVSPKVLGEKLAEEIKARDFKKVAIVTAEGSGSLADRDGLVEALKRLGLENRVVINNTFEPGVTDYRTTLSKIRSKQADAVVTILFPGALSSFAQQYRQQKISAELIGMETFEDLAEVKASKGALNNAWYVNAESGDEKFTQLYLQRWGKAPGLGSANGFDTVSLVGQAIGNGAVTSEQISKYLSTVKDFSGTLGVYSASGDNRFTLPAVLKRVVNLEFKVIESSK